MNYVYQHLSRDKILISGLVLIAIEKIRLAGVEQLLNSGFLTAEELNFSLFDDKIPNFIKLFDNSLPIKNSAEM